MVDNSGSSICQQPMGAPVENASTATLTLSAGDHSIHLLYPVPEINDLGWTGGIRRVHEPVTVTVAAGASDTLIIDLAPHLGLGRGVLTIGGATPPVGVYGVCVSEFMHGSCGPVGSDGSFAVLNWPGTSGVVARHRESYATAANEGFAYTADTQADLGTFAATPGTLRLVPTLAGAPLADQGVEPWMYCGMQLRIDGSFASPRCGAEADLVVEGVMPGQRELTLRTYHQGPDLPEVLLDSASALVMAGAVLEWNVPMDSAYGLATGRLETVDGSPQPGYGVCVEFGGCVSSDETGAFRVLSRVGSRKLTLRNSSGVPIREVAYFVAPGEVLDLGAISATPAGADVTVQLTFRGSPVPPEAMSPQWCAFQLLVNGAHAPVWLCDPANPGVAVLRATAAGETRLQLEYPGGFTVVDTTITVVEGEPQSLALELGRALGMVSATVTVNGSADFPDHTYYIRRDGEYDTVSQRWITPFLHIPVPSGGLLRYFDFPGARLALIQPISNSTELARFGYSVVAGEVTIVGTTSGGAAGETETGDSVVVKPVDSTDGSTTVELTFASVISDGQTTVSSSTEPPLANPLPDSVTAGTSPVYYEISTSATVEGTIRLCFNYGDDHGFENESEIRLYHGLADGTWEDITVAGYPQTEINLICGESSSLSPFVLVQPRLPASPIGRLEVLVGRLPELGLGEGVTNALRSKLGAAIDALERGNTKTAANQLGAFVNQVDALVGSGRLSEAQAQGLKSFIDGVLARF